MADTMNLRTARAHLADVVSAAESGASTVLTRNGTPVAAIVPVEAFDALEAAADELLAREAVEVLEAEGDGPKYTVAEVIADIFEEQNGTGAA